MIRKASEGEEVVSARGSKPVARLVSVAEVKGKRRPGSLKGSLRVGPEKTVSRYFAEFSSILTNRPSVRSLRTLEIGKTWLWLTT
jgi:hypothetical protein